MRVCLRFMAATLRRVPLSSCIRILRKLFLFVCRMMEINPSESTCARQVADFSQTSNFKAEIMYLFARLTSIYLSCSAIIFLASCANSPPIDEQKKLAAQTYTPPKGKAFLYVYRPSGGLVPRPIWVNGEEAGSTGRGTFVAISLNPGTHSIQASALALFDSPAAKKSYPDIELQTTAGKTYFIYQYIDHGRIGDNSTMLLQTGGSPIPLPIGGGFPPYRANLVSTETGKTACSKLRQVSSEIGF